MVDWTDFLDLMMNDYTVMIHDATGPQSFPPKLFLPARMRWFGKSQTQKARLDVGVVQLLGPSVSMVEGE